MRIDSKVVLITGASEGLGAACAAEFSRAGARLSLTARSSDALRRVGGPDVLITAGDLTLESVRRSTVEWTLDRYGRIDALINNAGVGLYRPSYDTPLHETRRLWELNFFAALSLTQLVVPHMQRQGSGAIVNISSVAGLVALPWMPLYSASKAALASWTEALRMELRYSGIQVMLVCPGYIRTAFHRHSMGDRPPAAIARGKRFAITADECARAIRRGFERNARTVRAPRSVRLLELAARWFPGTVERALAKINGTA